MIAAGHPKRHGYVQCCACRVWIPDENSKKVSVTTSVMDPVQGLVSRVETSSLCVDIAWCNKQSGEV